MSRAYVICNLSAFTNREKCAKNPIHKVFNACIIIPDQSSNQEGSHLAQGLSLAYERRVTMEADVKEVQENLESEQSLEDLMNQMKQLWKTFQDYILAF